MIGPLFYKKVARPFHQFPFFDFSQLPTGGLWSARAIIHGIDDEGRIGLLADGLGALVLELGVEVVAVTDRRDVVAVPPSVADSGAEA